MDSLKARIAKAFHIAYSQWINNDSDHRKQREVHIDFTVSAVGVELAALKIALENTNHLLAVLIADPLVQKDQKAYIINRLEANKKTLMTYEEESEAASA